MSSYLVGLVVSDFTCVTRNAVNAGPNGNLLVKVCARPNVPEEQLMYGLNISIMVVEAFERLYNIKYPLPKCGMIFFLCSLILKYLFNQSYVPRSYCYT